MVGTVVYEERGYAYVVLEKEARLRVDGLEQRAVVDKHSPLLVRCGGARCVGKRVHFYDVVFDLRARSARAGAVVVVN